VCVILLFCLLYWLIDLNFFLLFIPYLSFMCPFQEVIVNRHCGYDMMKLTHVSCLFFFWERCSFDRTFHIWGKDGEGNIIACVWASDFAFGFVAYFLKHLLQNQCLYCGGGGVCMCGLLCFFFVFLFVCLLCVCVCVCVCVFNLTVFCLLYRTIIAAFRSTLQAVYQRVKSGWNPTLYLWQGWL
jgi:hypothetical protein